MYFVHNRAGKFELETYSFSELYVLFEHIRRGVKPLSNLERVFLHEIDAREYADAQNVIVEREITTRNCESMLKGLNG